MRCRRRFSSLMEWSGFRGLDCSWGNEYNLADRSLEALPTGSGVRGLDNSPGNECNLADRSPEALTTMDSVLDCPDAVFSEEFADESSTPDNPGIVADPLVKPRIGHAFQVQIPALITEFDHLQMMTKRDVFVSHFLGSPIPVVWVHNEAPEKEDCRIKLCGLGKDKVVAMVVDDGEIIRPTRHNHKNVVKFSFDSNSCYYLAPGSAGQTWSKIEVESFVLGLYIFNKDFNKVRKFIESREMGDVLEFYYSKFRGSIMYNRWLNFQKMGSNRCPAGHKIFRGGRQKKLLCRLLPQVSEESQIILSEATWKFSEGRISLEEYVSTIKSTVGITALVAAIGIGDQGTDLTQLVMKTPKADKVSARSRILHQESFCSSTFEEIVGLLKGGKRLSKARSNNLFWDAVWPRLLSQGWHSEQPDRKSWSSDGPHFVFIIPGLQEFSRELVKGEHVFDSICDILGKVAADPELLLLEDEKSRLSNSTSSAERSSEAEAAKGSILARKRKGYQKSKGSTHKAAASNSSMKWSRLTRCATLMTNASSENFSVDSKQKHEDDTLTSNLEASANNLLSQTGPSPDQVICISSSDEGSPEKRPQPRLWLDLNVPVAPLVFGSGGSLSEESPSNTNSSPSCFNSVDDEPMENPTDDEMTSDVTWTVEKPNVSTSQRRSSRTRPLTSKALEAIARGFIDVKKNRKRRS